jgi:hypothetical protein
VRVIFERADALLHGVLGHVVDCFVTLPRCWTR